MRILQGLSSPHALTKAMKTAAALSGLGLASLMLVLALVSPKDAPTAAPLPQKRGQLYVTGGAPAASPGIVAVAAAQTAALAHLPFNALVDAAAERHGVPASLVHAVIHTESRGNPDAVSRVGAQGLMQLMPATARQLDVANAFDARQNIEGGVKYLRQLAETFEGDPVKTVAAYNAGPAAVKRYGGAVPPFAETQKYVRKVMGLYSKYETPSETPSLQPVEDSTSVLFWPSPGVVLRPLKPRGTDPLSGIEIRVRAGASVRSASEGTVVAIQSDKQGQKTITVRHDDRFTTVYAKLAVVLVSKGDRVWAGDILGNVAVTDGAPGGVLRFDLRESGSPRNPLEYRWRSVHADPPPAPLAPQSL